MATETGPATPSLPWRTGSAVVTGIVGTACRVALLAGNRLEVNGLEKFLDLLDNREDVPSRRRGLITVSNHTSVIDDPLMWGALPFRYHFSPNSVRWSLGSHDIVFKNKAMSTFFILGQTLPTHRIAHSHFGGPFQPTIAQTIRLLSSQPFTRHFPYGQTRPLSQPAEADPLPESIDPFTDPSSSTYTTNGIDSIHAPSYYSSRRHAWIHIFPEGRIHQHPDRIMRYFKWGVARLILEAQPAPTLVPIWIEGFDQMMHENRKFPRWIPRMGKNVSITFGESVDTEQLCGDLRTRWEELVNREMKRENDTGNSTDTWEVGVLQSEDLKTGHEARKLREECTLRIREEVLKVRRKRGWPDEDPKARLVDTWREEGRLSKRQGQMNDGSWVRDT